MFTCCRENLHRQSQILEIFGKRVENGFARQEKDLDVEGGGWLCRGVALHPGSPPQHGAAQQKSGDAGFSMVPSCTSLPLRPDVHDHKSIFQRSRRSDGSLRNAISAHLVPMRIDLSNISATLSLPFLSSRQCPWAWGPPSLIDRARRTTCVSP